MSGFTFSINRYGGVFIDPSSLPQNGRLRPQLTQALTTWEEAGYVTVWLSIPEQQSDLISTATKLGFAFHHVNKNELMLVLRLQSDAIIPDNASHFLGAGGVVINDQNELLVIRERVHESAKMGHYKLPGGFIEVGAHLVTGIEREVLEETGIEAQFERLVCFRHWHVNRFGSSDIYSVCRLRPLTHKIKLQEAEIAECCWMPVDKFLNHADVGVFNKGVVKLALAEGGLEPGWIGNYNTAPEIQDNYELFVPK